MEGGVHAAGPHLAAGTARATFYVRLAFVFMCARMCMSMLMLHAGTTHVYVPADSTGTALFPAPQSCLCSSGSLRVCAGVGLQARLSTASNDALSSRGGRALLAFLALLEVIAAASDGALRAAASASAGAASAGAARVSAGASVASDSAVCGGVVVLNIGVVVALAFARRRPPHEVCGLDVAMHEAEAVDRLERRQHACEAFRA